mmetsp:Transcript_66678/g.124529  ORF Transcript_66678/g.124529 Transcript_66678/m.124529 type:complete len:615 (+) Transcript_66678:56-1900(+)
MPIGRPAKPHYDLDRPDVEFGPDGRLLDEDNGLAAYTMEAHMPDPGPKPQVFAGRGHGERDALLSKGGGPRCCFCFPARWGKLWPDVLVPWVFFALMMYPFGLPWAKGYAAPVIFGLCAFLSILFILYSRSTGWKLFGLLCLLCVLLGLTLGYDNYSRYLNDYYIYYYSRSHKNVLPSGNPGATKDAGSIVFTSDSYVATSMTVGLKSSSLYCVAPIMAHTELSSTSSNSSSSSDSSTIAPAAGYWAVGTDCCQVRSNFECGDAGVSGVHSGLVVIDEPSHAEKLSKWRSAAELAAGTYGLTLPPSVTFVYWLEDTSGAIMEQQTKAQDTYLRYLFLGFIPIALVSFLLLWRGTDSMNTKELLQMEYACGWCSMFCEPRREKRASADVVRDLLHKRAYWSGEIAHDWWFYVCNDHDFVGMLLCHPAHPYSKVERVLTFFIISAVTFIVSIAVTEALSNSMWSRLAPVIILLFVTLPLKAVVAALKKTFVRDAEMLLDHGRAHEDAERARSQSIILGVVALVIGIIAVLVAGHSLDSHNVSKAYAIRLYFTTELFRAVTQLILELVMPQIVHGKSPSDKRMCIGFVHRWFSERQDYIGRALATGKVDRDVVPSPF